MWSAPWASVWRLWRHAYAYGALHHSTVGRSVRDAAVEPSWKDEAAGTSVAKDAIPAAVLANNKTQESTKRN